MYSMEDMAPLSPPKQRSHQRYNDHGGRRIVGCIPYRFKTSFNKSTGENGISVNQLEVLVISSQNGGAILFPKGGWEEYESMEDAVLREAEEEAGVRGIIKDRLGKWIYVSRRHKSNYEGVMFSFIVKEELSEWLECHRERRWVSVEEVKKGCPHIWMKEALDKLVDKLFGGVGQQQDALEMERID
ncbi:hypothetical protein QJS04_geneDACA012018 [Acorus gramineus]|uniref:Nudix hydrolase domain-containing protein n=1 Tax=Acorus gramineus TaxID=55184 RepID=A0AAV9AFR6_ACOGR|nr:hypothetical protein QJS04_geneDACA012018 [Acorus gramineus]